MQEQLRLSGDENHIPALEIASTVERSAKILDGVYGHADEVVALVFMQGAMVFASDLVRAMKHPNIVVDTVRPKNYSGTKPSDKFSVRYEPDGPLKNRHVLLVEDIRDRGKTLYNVANKVAKSRPASLHIVSMFDKPECRLPGTELTVADGILTGMKIANKFVVGYGLDWEGRYRHLKHLTIAVESEPNSKFYVPAVT